MVNMTAEQFVERHLYMLMNQSAMVKLLETFARERVLVVARAIKAEVQAAFDKQPEAGPTETRLAFSWVLARCRQRIKQIEGQ
jgi:hypothetical protein